MMSSAPLTYVFVIIAAYLLGSVPFGLILTRLAGKGDIRSIGSGNIGATNVLRTGSKPLAALTLILDAGKGAAITLLVAAYADTTAMALAGCTAVIGHCFPIWLKFRGGKGVATSLAVFAAFDWRLGLLFCGIWLGTAAVTNYSSLAALLATLGCAMAGFILPTSAPVAIATAGLAGLIWVRHHQNIGRLLSGQESRIGGK